MIDIDIPPPVIKPSYSELCWIFQLYEILQYEKSKLPAIMTINAKKERFDDFKNALKSSIPLVDTTTKSGITFINVEEAQDKFITPFYQTKQWLFSRVGGGAWQDQPKMLMPVLYPLEYFNYNNDFGDGDDDDDGDLLIPHARRLSDYEQTMLQSIYIYLQASMLKTSKDVFVNVVDDPTSCSALYWMIQLFKWVRRMNNVTIPVSNARQLDNPLRKRYEVATHYLLPHASIDFDSIHFTKAYEDHLKQNLNRVEETLCACAMCCKEIEFLKEKYSPPFFKKYRCMDPAREV